MIYSSKHSLKQLLLYINCYRLSPHSDGCSSLTSYTYVDLLHHPPVEYAHARPMLNTRSHAYNVFSTHREYHTNVSTHSTTYSIPILSVSCVLAAKKRVTRALLAGTHLSAADFSYEYNHVIQTITVNVIMRNGKNCTIIMNSIYVTNRYKKKQLTRL